MLKILVVSKYDKDGGAAIAAYRMHKSLLSSGVHSRMLVQKKVTGDYTVVGPISIIQRLLGSISYYIDQLPVYFYKNKSTYLFSTAWFSSGDILRRINKFSPDIVHLHWSCKGMISIRDIAKIKSPVVLTMHDSWSFTGGCHIPWECKKYLAGCGTCPELGSTIRHDLSSRIFNRKLKLYTRKKDITVVAVSKWLQSCAQESALFKRKDVQCIPNALDTNDFFPVDKTLAKSILNLDPKKKLILFGAISAISDLNKGFEELSTALNQLSGIDTEIAIFGGDRPEEERTSKYKIHYFGHLHDSISLKILYSAADVMVVPSLMEAFGQTASESMSCGTPVVAFNTTGLRDIVDHKINGYLARAFDTGDLSKGIEWVLLAENYEELSKNARNKALKEFDGGVIANKYISLYKKCLDFSKSKG